MKVFAINCYEKEENKHGGEKILKTFLAALNNFGADTQEILVRDSQINECRHCTERIDFVPPIEHCYQNDGMNELYHPLAESDVWLFAFEHYITSPNELLKVFIDRLEPLFRLDNLTNTTLSKGKIVIISSFAFWDTDVFIPVIEEFNEFAKLYSKELVGQILIPRLLQKSHYDEEQSSNIVLDAVRMAAKNLVFKGEIPEEIQNIINSEILLKKKTKFVEI